jgi:hypothetical protein
MLLEKVIDMTTMIHEAKRILSRRRHQEQLTSGITDQHTHASLTFLCAVAVVTMQYIRNECRNATTLLVGVVSGPPINAKNGLKSSSPPG